MVGEGENAPSDTSKFGRFWTSLILHHFLERCHKPLLLWFAHCHDVAPSNSPAPFVGHCFARRSMGDSCPDKAYVPLINMTTACELDSRRPCVPGPEERPGRRLRD